MSTKEDTTVAKLAVTEKNTDLSVLSQDQFNFFTEQAVDNEVVKTENFPHLQLVNPKDPSVEAAIKKGTPWGVFFLKEKADLFRFKKNKDWGELQTLFLGENGDEVEGYLTKRARFVFLDMGQPFIQKKNKDRWDYQGLAWENGKPTKHYVEYKSNNSNQDYRMRTRNYVLLVDENNQLLVNPDPKAVEGETPDVLPIIFSFSTGIGGTLGNDLRSWVYPEYEKVMYQLLNPDSKKKNVGYNWSIKLNFVIDITFGLHKVKGSSGSIFHVPEKILLPTLGECGIVGEKSLTDKEKQVRIVKTETVNIRKLLLSPEVSKIVKQTQERYVLPALERNASFNDKEETDYVSYQDAEIENQIAF